MIAYLSGSGFLSTRGTVGADASLVIMVAAAILLTVGFVLARSGRYRAHRWVQTCAVILNAIPVVFWMIRAFWLYILPGLPGTLGMNRVALTTVHAVAGLIGVCLGMFVMIRANQLEAKGEDLSRYKRLMRVAYTVYMLVTVVGVVLYVVVYG
jgi:uncharacterized membrane protein YozB (DUF420 family)